MNAVDWINEKYHAEKNHPDFKAGDQVRVHVKIKEGEKERVQVYEGLVIRIHRNGAGSSFTVRKTSYGVGVERIFPFSSPTLDKIELVSSGRVRRAKLYYLRELSGKKARIIAEERFLTGDESPAAPATVIKTPAAETPAETSAKSA